LSITMSAASSCTILSGMRCARGASSGGRGGATEIFSPPVTGVRGRAERPSTVMWPALSHSWSRLREYWWKRRASAWSRRSPPISAGTVAESGATNVASHSL